MPFETLDCLGVLGELSIRQSLLEPSVEVLELLMLRLQTLKSQSVESRACLGSREEKTIWQM